MEQLKSQSNLIFDFESSPFFFLKKGRCGADQQPIKFIFHFRVLGHVIRIEAVLNFQGECPDGMSRLCSDGAQTRRFSRFRIFVWLTGLLNFEIFSPVEFKERLLSHIFRGTLSPKLIES